MCHPQYSLLFLVLCKIPADFLRPPTAPPELPEPTTLAERTRHRYYQTNPLEKRREDAGGIHALTPIERLTYVYAALVPRVLARDVTLGNKADREFWKYVSKESLPARRLSHQQRDYAWGHDRLGRDLGALSLAHHQQRAISQARLAALEAQHRRFLQRKALAARGYTGPDGAAVRGVTDDEIADEKKRRKEMAGLKKELYGEKMGPYATDPEWDDVVPIPVIDPEGALAAIAYPEDYAEGVYRPLHNKSCFPADSPSHRLPPRRHGRRGVLPPRPPADGAHH